MMVLIISWKFPRFPAQAQKYFSLEKRVRHTSKAVILKQELLKEETLREL